jgi:diguanylate cyclase (GGDEF)-like protein
MMEQLRSRWGSPGDPNTQPLLDLDPLTELPNRSSLIASLDACLTAAAKTGDAVALLLVDLDRFRSINDSLGHEAGDVLLQIIGKRLRALSRRSDIVAHMGGDEFAVVLTHITSRGDVDRAASRMLSEISLPLALCNREVTITASSGICLFPEEAATASEMLRSADIAMHQAKHSGHNNWQFGTRAMSRHARAALDLESDMRRALRRHEFQLHYQPQLDLRSGEIRSVEALIRWNRPGGGLTMPGRFIPQAEECGLITQIGAWTLRAAVQQLASWERAGAPVPRVAVNLSATQFHRGNLFNSLRAELIAGGLAASRLELEITEGVIVQDARATIELLQQLHDLGVGISIDDFGIGYSSLSYLRRLPLDTIKIDRSFIEDMTTDPAAAGIVRGIIELAHGLNLRVLAEGVETTDQLRQLRALNCDGVQGFLISRPLPAAQLEDFLKRWSPLALGVDPPIAAVAAIV